VPRPTSLVTSTQNDVPAGPRPGRRHGSTGRSDSCRVTCRVLGFSKQAFYAWRKNPVTQRDWDDAHLINLVNAALDVHADDPSFGYRFIADELAAQGVVAGENRVARLCSQQRIWSIHSKKRGLNRKAGPPVHDDLVERGFTASAPNLVWLTDITEHATGEARSTCARSRTSAPTGSSATPSTRG
jgi:hypothetical protein